MSNSTSPIPHKRRWRPWQVLLVLLSCIVLFYLGYQSARYQQNVARMNAAIEATDKVDPAWRLADLMAEYEKLPVSPVFLQILSFPFNVSQTWHGDDIEERPGAIEYDRRAKDFNVRFPPSFFAILDKRLKSPELQQIRDDLTQLLNEPDDLRIPHLDVRIYDKIHYLKARLQDEFELAAHRADGEAIVELLRKTIKVSFACRSHPNPHMQFNSNLVRGIGVGYVRRALALGTLSPASLESMQKQLSEADQSRLVYLLRSIRAEMFDELEAANHDPAARKKVSDSITMQLPMSKPPTLMDRINYYRRWFEIESDMKELPLAQAELLETFNEAIELAHKQPENVLLYLDKKISAMTNLISKRYAQNCSRLVSVDLTIQTELRTVMVGLACERYRLATGAWPKSLIDLQPAYLKELPLDPYSGKALLYRQLPDGVVVYSVYRNGVDDGGDVLRSDRVPDDRGVKLFNPQLRGRKFEEVYPDRVRAE